jgi:SulP family sulfate permease
MDHLQRADLLDQLTGSVFLTHHQAMMALSPEVTARATRGETVQVN